MIKVLHLLPGLGRGGIATVIYNYYVNMDKTKVHFDFAVFKHSTEGYVSYFEQNGCKIFVLPKKSDGLKQYCDKLGKILDEGNYDVVHAHQNYMSFIPLYVAKKHHVKGRIAHSHTSKLDSDSLLQKICYRISKVTNNLVCTNMLACGKLAGEFVFGKKAVDKGIVEILPNAITLDKYKYNYNLRQFFRNEYNIDEDCKVIGIIGRLSKEKNCDYAIEIIRKLNNNVKLIYIGDGENRELLENLIIQYSLQNKVLLIGNQDNVNQLYSMLDVVVMPSLHEGFPMVAVEAIANGLQLILSTKITDEFKSYQGVCYCDLESVDSWVDAINKIAINDRKDNLQLLRDNNLDIDLNIEKLQEIYESFGNN